MIRLIEELSLNAWPGGRVMHFDGWSLQFAGGYTRRANSVNLVGQSILPIEDKVRFCEDAYRLADQATIFKIFPDPETKPLDQFLKSRGYREEGNAYVMVKQIEVADQLCQGDFHLETELTDWWLEAAICLNQINDPNAPHLSSILRSIKPTCGFASIRNGDEPVAVGLGVLERGWFGLFDIVTAEPYRRQGHGKALVQNMIEWSRQQDAHHAYLQVMTQNQPAQELYRSLGFEHQYEYWYRVLP